MPTIEVRYWTKKAIEHVGLTLVFMYELLLNLSTYIYHQ